MIISFRASGPSAKTVQIPAKFRAVWFLVSNCEVCSVRQDRIKSKEPACTLPGGAPSLLREPSRSGVLPLVRPTGIRGGLLKSRGTGGREARSREVGWWARGVTALVAGRSTVGSTGEDETADKEASMRPEAPRGVWEQRRHGHLKIYCSDDRYEVVRNPRLTPVTATHTSCPHPSAPSGPWHP